MILGEPVDGAALAREMRGEEEPLKYSPNNPNVLIVPALGPRKTPFEPEFHTDRDEILQKALTYLSEHNAPYIPFDIEDDIQASYEDDAIEDFRETVRGWIKALVTVSRGAA